MTILETIKEKAEKREEKHNKPVSIEEIRSHHSDKNFEEIGKAIDRLMINGEIYEPQPAKFCYI